MKITDKESLIKFLNDEVFDDEKKEEISSFVEKLVSEKETTIQERNKVIEEIKGLRKKNQELEAIKPQPNISENDAEKLVRSIIDKDKAGKLESNHKKALNKFWESHPEFHPNNDTSGLKMDLLKETLARLKTEGHFDVEEIMEDYETANSLINKPVKTRAETPASTPSSSGTPKVSNTEKKINLTSEEEKLINFMGVSKEKIEKKLLEKIV